MGHGQSYGGKVERITGQEVTWIWMDEETSQTDMQARQKGALITDKEMECLEKNRRLNQHEVQDEIDRAQAPRATNEALQQEQGTSSLSGFSNIDNRVKWKRLLEEWLPTFNPTAFLTRRINAEAPKGIARSDWTDCVRATTNLLMQHQVISEDGGYEQSGQLHDQLQMLARCLPILLLRVPPQAPPHMKIKVVRDNCACFLRGEWQSLTEKALKEMEEANQSTKEKIQEGRIRNTDDSAKRAAKALEQAQNLNYSKAMHTLRAPGLPPGDAADTIRRLAQLHPPEKVQADGWVHPGTVPQNKDTFDFINGKWLDKQLQRSKAGTAVDQWGWDSREMWDPLRKDTELMEQIAELWFRPIAAGYLPSAYKTNLAGGRLVALSKHPKPGVRPINISDAWRRLVAKGLSRKCQSHFQKYFQHGHPRVLQCGGNTKNGATNMFHTLASVAESVRDPAPDPACPRLEPIVLLALDSTNAFNTLKRQVLMEFLQKGTEQVNGIEEGNPHTKPVGWDILWRHIQAHYGTPGTLKLYLAGEVSDIFSEAGVQQGDPLGSTLFALAIHPTLIKIAEAYEVLITAYADNVIISGPLSSVLAAQEMYRKEMGALGLQLNAGESEIYIPEWREVETDLLAGMPGFSRSQLEGQTVEFMTMANGELIRLAREGIKILGCPLGTSTFCQRVVEQTAASIEGDLVLLSEFPHIHQRIKLATYCANTRATYYLRAVKLATSMPIMKKLDASFDNFLAQTLQFEQGHETSERKHSYRRALIQSRLGIKQGGCGLTSNAMAAPAANYAALSAFARWLVKEQAQIQGIPWIHEHIIKHDLQFAYGQEQLVVALEFLENDWSIHSSSDPEDKETGEGQPACILNMTGILAAEAKQMPSQQQILKHMKATQRATFLDSLPHDDKHRLHSVSLSTVPSQAEASDMASPQYHSADKLRQVPMGLFALTCPYELSNEAILTSTAFLLGYPVPHARFLKEQVQGYETIDIWGDSLLNTSTHGAAAWKATHDNIAKEIASIATGGGVSTIAVERRIPYCESTSRKRGDMMTTVGGLIPLSRRRQFNKYTKIIMDMRLGHTFSTAGHAIKKNTIKSMEQSKRAKFRTLYREKGYAFAPMVANTWGNLGPDLLRFLWAVADHAARYHLALPQHEVRALPQSCLTLSQDEMVTDKLEKSFKALRGKLNNEYRQRVLTAVYEGVAERVWGRTHALSANKYYHDTMALGRAAWQPVFHNVPVTGPSASASEAASSPPPHPVLAHLPVSPAGAVLHAEGSSLSPASSLSVASHSHAVSPLPMLSA